MDTVARTLWWLNDFIVAVVKGTGLGLDVSEKRGRRCFRATTLSRAYYERLNDFVALYAEGQGYPLCARMFYRVCTALGLMEMRWGRYDETSPTGVLYGDLFNLLVVKLREEAVVCELKKAIHKERSMRRLQYLDLVDYVDALFEHERSRLIVVRVDFGYRQEAWQTMPPEQRTKDWQRLLERARNGYGPWKDLVGYIWKLERSSYGGEHYHLLCFFRNDICNDDSWLAEQIGKCWRDDVTAGRGTYHSCHRSSEIEKYKRMKRLAVGHVNHDDDEKRFALLFILAYFCKEEQSLMIKPGQQHRTMGRGRFPKEKAERYKRARKDPATRQRYLRLIDDYLAFKEAA